jgi:diadenosine tetraphosphate (Ap4A) HIT family hydrolase
MSSPFLAIDPSAWVASNELAFAIRDRFPVTDGHTLVVPKRLVATWFDASREEQQAIFDLVEEVKRQLDAELSPDGYNVGFNAGAAAGQTVMHLHVHVIPRYRGDMDDPRGGVRHVIPSRGNYLASQNRFRRTYPPLPGFMEFYASLGPARDLAVVRRWGERDERANPPSRIR